MERPAPRKVEQRRRAEQTRSEIGSLAYGVVHFITRNVEATVHRADAINGAAFSEPSQRMTAVRQFPLDQQEKRTTSSHCAPTSSTPVRWSTTAAGKANSATTVTGCWRITRGR